MQQIIAPINKALLKQELNKQTFLRHTNKGDNELYIVDNNCAPNVITEIGRLRELSFRVSGGGTGQPLDLDKFDTGTIQYKQLIVWCPEDENIIGGYRYIVCKNAFDSEGVLNLSTSSYFNFSDDFIKNYLPYTIELGRSFVQPAYQSKEGNRKGLFSLDNLWDGLGALTKLHPEMNYFFGKVTMYQKFNQTARDCIISFLHHYFPDTQKMITAKPNLYKGITNEVQDFLSQIKDKPFKDGHLILNHKVKELEEHIPPLINSYMNLSSTMKTFESALNPDFGDVEETGILIDIRDIYPTKKDRHITTFQPQ